MQMVFVKVRVNPSDLLSHMADMRVWLDSKHIGTAGFSYNQRIAHATARVAFKATADAEAFAARFSGRIIHSVPSAVEIAPPLPAAPASVAI
jgi:hypothetical protein